MNFEVKNRMPDLCSLTQDIIAKPFIKWAEGKTQLLAELLKYVPQNYNKYIKPFIGSGRYISFSNFV